MIFHEIYGTYYTIISQLLAQAAEGTLTKAQLYTTVRERGFAESSLTIPRHLLEQTWPLLQKDLTTPLRGRPERPLTLLPALTPPLLSASNLVLNTNNWIAACL